MIHYKFVSFALIFTLYLSCSSEQKNDERRSIPRPTRDRFAEQFVDITEIASIKQLTDEGCDHQPFFNQLGNLVYFERYNYIKVDTESVAQIDHWSDYLSVDYITGQIYFLEKAPQKPKSQMIMPEYTSSLSSEETMYGLKSGDDIYITIINPNDRNWRKIYKQVNDSLTQITFGRKSSYLQTISPDGRYVAFLYDNAPTSLVVYDNITGNYYDVPKPPADSSRFDLAPAFSPDSKYMAFIRSGDGYSPEMYHYGNIWLVEFKNDDQ